MTDQVIPSLMAGLNRINEAWDRRSELTHILTASVLLSFLTYFIFDTSAIGIEHSLLVSFLIIAPSVMLHEMMHVKMAKELDHKQARYVAYLPFLIISILIVLFFRRPFLLLPGFAKISENRTIQYPIEWYHPRLPFGIKIRNKYEEVAFIAIGGAIANLFLVFTAFALLLVLQAGFISSLLSTILIVNFNLMAFNMLPIPMLDGGHVFRGNKRWFALMWIMIIASGVFIFLLNNNFIRNMLV